MSVAGKLVCHVTTLHPRCDVRIFVKECVSLAVQYDIVLLVADGRGDEQNGKVRIIDTGERSHSRLLRFALTSYRLYSACLKLRCDLVHFHDPDFLFFAYLLKLRGKKVIYDAHEDLPRQILGKEYISPVIRRTLSYISEIVENFLSRKFNAIVTATPAIERRFKKQNRNVVTVSNFPSSMEFEPPADYQEKQNKICYVGGISKVRGISELLASLEHVKSEIKLIIAGQPENNKILKKISSNDKVEFHGTISRDKIIQLLRVSKIGMVTLYPVPNHLESYPVKMFEYMAAGLPVIASGFPLWKKIITEHGCGICINPSDPLEVARAINYILDHPSEAIEMGNRGRELIINKFNWEHEFQKLSLLYSGLILQ